MFSFKFPSGRGFREVVLPTATHRTESYNSCRSDAREKEDSMPVNAITQGPGGRPKTGAQRSVRLLIVPPARSPKTTIAWLVREVNS